MNVLIETRGLYEDIQRTCALYKISHELLHLRQVINHPIELVAELLEYFFPLF